MNKELVNIMDDLDTHVFNIKKEMSSKERFDSFRERMYMLLNKGFEIKEYREYPVKFRFESGGRVYTEQFRHFITNLFFWIPFAHIGEDITLDASHIVDTRRLSQKYVKDYIDNKIIIPYSDSVSLKKMNKILENMIYQISNNIVSDYALILGLSINIETFMDVANKNKRFNEIIRTKLDERMQPTEIEKLIDDLSKEQIQILSTEDNLLKPFLLSGTGIKSKSLAEFSISGGLKPDLNGNTIPKPINSNLIVGGMNGVGNYFVDAISGRKSLIMNKMVMGTSGYFTKNVMLLCAARSLDTSGVACNSIHPIKYHIESMEEFKRFIGRYYRLQFERDYSIIRPSDTHLIGKTIFIKSPLTCASEKGICFECYGPELYKKNIDMNVGAFAGAIITNPINQNILSSKHLLSTASQVLSFEPEDVFNKLFVLNANEVFITEDRSVLNQYTLFIENEEIVSIDDFSLSDLMTFVNSFKIRHNSTGEVIEIREKEWKDLFLTNELIELLRIDKKQRDVYEIKMSDIPEETKLFIMEVGNNELTKPLYDIMKLLNVKTGLEYSGVNDLHDMCKVMTGLLIESEINIQNVHAEVVMSNLVRSKKNILNRPNFFKRDAMNDVEILTVFKALEKHPSILISISSHHLKRQLTKPLTYVKKDTSYLDPFYRE